MEELAYMVCTRVDENPDPVEGSTTTACVECGSDIWISAASKKEMHKRKAMPLCGRCALRLAKDMPSVTEVIGDLGEGQMDEIIGKLERLVAEVEAMPDDADAFETMKLTAAAAGREMTDPNEEWGSMAILEDYHGTFFPPVPISMILRSGIPKEQVAKQLLPACIQAAHAKTVLLGLATWMVRGEKEKVADLAPSEHPDRMEALVIIEITADGVQRMSTAEILRDGISTPRLGEWEDSEQPAGGDGLFVDATVATLQLVRTLHGS